VEKITSDFAPGETAILVLCTQMGIIPAALKSIVVLFTQVGIILEAIGTRWRHDRHGFVSQALASHAGVSFVMMMMMLVIMVVTSDAAARSTILERCSASKDQRAADVRCSIAKPNFD